MQASKNLTYIFLRAWLKYDAQTGAFYWRHHTRVTRKGKRADTLRHMKRKTRDYFTRTICIKKKKWIAARLAWLYMTGKWPENEIDHVDCDGTNTKWLNLREATRLQNCANTRLRTDNTSKFKGVSWDAARNKWTASIYISGKRYSLGRYHNKEDAIAIRTTANERLYKEFARHV